MVALCTLHFGHLHQSLPVHCVDLDCAALIALARVHAGLKDELTVNGSGKSKRVLLEMLEDYFTRMRATLPRLQRVTAGVGALRLVEEV